MNLDNLLADVRRWGWMRSLCIRVTIRLQRYTGLHIYRVGVRTLVRHPPAYELPSGITLRVAQPEELMKAADDPQLDLTPDFIRGALARGDVAFGAFDGECLIGYSWRTFTAFPHSDGVWARVDRPYFFGYKAFTRPSFRGKRIHAAVALFSDSYLLERGYLAEVGLIDIANFASLRLARYLHRRRIGYAGYVKWFGRVLPFRTPAVKRIGVELFELLPQQEDRLRCVQAAWKRSDE
jgi:hypothetical protein